MERGTTRGDEGNTDVAPLRDRHDHDLAILDRLEPPVRDWWLDRFARHVPRTGGLFTPPQRDAIPAIQDGTNTLICSPTGSGKCVHPSTPVLVERHGRVSVRAAGSLRPEGSTPIARVEDGGHLFDADLKAFSLDRATGAVERRRALLFEERYAGPLHVIRTADGRRVACTPDHPLLVRTPDGETWRRASAIEQGDEIGVPGRLELPTAPVRAGTRAALERLHGHPATTCRTGWDASGRGRTDGGHIASVMTADPGAPEGRVGMPARLELAVDGVEASLALPTELGPKAAELAGRLLATRLHPDREEDDLPVELVREILDVRFESLPANTTAGEATVRLLDGPLRPALAALVRLEDPTEGRWGLPDWPLNAPTSVKRALLTGLLRGLPDRGDADGRTIEHRDHLSIERLDYLCLALGVPTTRLGPSVSSDAATADRSVERLVIAAPASEAASGPSRPEAPGASSSRGSPGRIRWVRVEATGRERHEGTIVDLSVPGPANYVGGFGAMFMHNTLASFTAIIDDLVGRDRAGTLGDGVHCLYVSPLKSLANDVHRNLEIPLEGIADRLPEGHLPIRHAIRHGDTDDSTRRGMLDETPHILNTTPETLAILLNSPKFRERLRRVEYVIVDEIHSLAANKRGTHLAVSLERLARLVDRPPVRIGCSATVEPIDRIAAFLVGRSTPGGEPRPYRVIDTRFARDYDIELLAPADDLVNTPPWEIQDRFYDLLHDLIRDHENTLVFTNTRSGAERVLFNLRERFAGAYDESNSGCHHGSLSESERVRVEEGLKAGELEVVTTSTSLELGIDMPHVDLVVQVGSPKSVASLLQRIGRAGHRPGRTVTGRVVALDRDELVECAVMLRQAAAGAIDRIRIPENAHDVAAQHVYGMAINEVLPEAEARGTLRRAYPYRGYDDARWETLMRYLTADYEGLEERNVYAKIWRDENDPPGGEHHHEGFAPGTRLLGRRGRLARPIYLTNVGTIPDSFTCQVFTRAEDEWVGDLDEGYLDTLEPGDVFILGGRRFEFRYRRGSKVYADPTEERPTVPSWFSERLPLSTDMGRAILDFQSALLERRAAGGSAAVRSWLRSFPIDEHCVRAIARMYDEQVRFAGEAGVSTPHRLTIEEVLDRERYKRRYYVHSAYGRRVNEGFSRLLAHACARGADAGVRVAVADNGFTLVVPMNLTIDVERLVADISPSAVRPLLRESLRDTDLLQRYFRINATRSLLILKRYKGYERTAGEQQVSSEMLLNFAEGLEDFAVIEETYREILEDKFAVDELTDVIGAIHAGDLEVETIQVPSPSPRAFGLATLSASDVVLAEDESAALRAFHERVRAAIEGDENA